PGGGFTLYDCVRLPACRDRARHFDSGGGGCRLLWPWLCGDGLRGVQFLLATGGDDRLDAVLDGFLTTGLPRGAPSAQLLRDLLGGGGDVDGRGAVVVGGDRRGVGVCRCVALVIPSLRISPGSSIVVVACDAFVVAVGGVFAVPGIVFRPGGGVATVG